MYYTSTAYTAKSGQNGKYLSGVGYSGGDGYSGGGSGMYRKITDATLATTTTTTTTTTTSTPPATTTTTTTMTTDASTTTTTIFRSRNVSVHIDADYRDIEDEEGNRLGEHHRGIATSEYKGGSNGGYGEGAGGGKGSGDDVTSFVFSSWKLSPGDPGQGYNGSYASYSSSYIYKIFYGGGGGGVLVDGAGPEISGTYAAYEGKGYGGGRGYVYYGSGGAGVILIEIVGVGQRPTNSTIATGNAILNVY